MVHLHIAFLAEFNNSDQVLKLPSTSLVLEVAFSGSNIGLALHHEKNLNMIKSSHSYIVAEMAFE